MTNTKTPKDKDPENKLESLQEKLSGKIESIKQNENVEHMLNFAKTNTRDTIAYVFLFVGILLMFFGSFWGGLIVGVICGIYFADTFIAWLVNFKNYIETEGLIRVMILSALGLGLLIQAPAIFLGVILTVTIKYLFGGKVK